MIQNLSQRIEVSQSPQNSLVTYCIVEIDKQTRRRRRGLLILGWRYGMIFDL